MSDDLYSILGVDRNSSISTIKSAYKKLALKYHPDRNQGDPKAERKFKEINKAYSILSDPDKRDAYDRSGSADFAESGHDQQSFGSEGFSDIFEQFFGSTFGGFQSDTKSRRGADYKKNVTISLEDAYNGVEVSLSIDIKDKCTHCKGSGSLSQSTDKCHVCKGRGSVRTSQGLFVMEKTCHACHGGGSLIKDPCHYCNSSGVLLSHKNIKVQIPPGVDSESCIKINKGGHAGIQGGDYGDLLIYVYVTQDSIFTREKIDLYCTRHIDIYTAIVGGKIRVPFFNQKDIVLDIPPEIQSGTKLVIKKHGMPRVQAPGRGHLYVKILPEIPRKVPSKAIKYLKSFHSYLGKNNYKKSSV